MQAWHIRNQHSFGLPLRMKMQRMQPDQVFFGLPITCNLITRILKKLRQSTALERVFLTLTLSFGYC